MPLLNLYCHGELLATIQSPPAVIPFRGDVVTCNGTDYRVERARHDLDHENQVALDVIEILNPHQPELDPCE